MNILKINPEIKSTINTNYKLTDNTAAISNAFGILLNKIIRRVFLDADDFFF